MLEVGVFQVLLDQVARVLVFAIVSDVIHIEIHHPLGHHLLLVRVEVLVVHHVLLHPGLVHRGPELLGHIVLWEYLRLGLRLENRVHHRVAEGLVDAHVL